MGESGSDSDIVIGEGVVVGERLEGLSDSEGSEEMEGSMDESSSDYKGHSEVYFNGQSFEGSGDKGNKAAAAAAGNGSKRTLPGNLGYPLLFLLLIWARFGCAPGYPFTVLTAPSTPLFIWN